MSASVTISLSAARALLAAGRDRLALVDREALIDAIGEVAEALQARELAESLKSPALRVVPEEPALRVKQRLVNGYPRR